MPFELSFKMKLVTLTTKMKSLLWLQPTNSLSYVIILLRLFGKVDGLQLIIRGILRYSYHT
jgi:hypothetical protein